MNAPQRHSAISYFSDRVGRWTDWLLISGARPEQKGKRAKQIFKASLNLHAPWLLVFWALVSGTAMASEPAEEWRASGSYFSWKSALPENAGKEVQVFYRCSGDVKNPVILMLHGFPTSSFDYRLLIAELQMQHRICTLDFPGYGVSDKPLGWRYSLHDDAKLVWDFVTTIVPLKEFVLLGHDRASSVSLDFLQLYQAAEKPPFKITHQFLMNANLYLPLSNLTPIQKQMLDPVEGPIAARNLLPQQMAARMGQTFYTPPLGEDDPEVKALAFNFEWKNGVQAVPATIQYLNERKKWEVGYLEALSKSTIPVTLVWGAHDLASPLRVANYVWETVLKQRPAAASYWIVPCSNHFLLHDQPKDLAGLIRLVLSGKQISAPYNLTKEACAPVLVDAH